ncbi:hypothetical protein GBAR_LOCUS19470 [Geodia barretti]|uniref:Uncharacterized protein n=1 Tax=Geodia barretti TaxID=519541 RepID=A0AA35STC5_GEOBA|nr:hypothetical protein GBAR_LOCUS19470 [Geodia barretti]
MYDVPDPECQAWLQQYHQDTSAHINTPPTIYCSRFAVLSTSIHWLLREAVHSLGGSNTLGYTMDSRTEEWYFFYWCSFYCHSTVHSTAIVLILLPFYYTLYYVC